MGYVGPGLVERLHSSYPGAQLLGLDMAYFAHCLTGARTLPERCLSVQHFGDVRHVGTEAFQDVHAVVHLAAISNDPMGNTYEAVTTEINQTASLRVARLAKQAGVKRFVFASSCSMYGYAEGGARRESDALNPLTAYARSKVGTEHGLRELASRDFVVTSLRFATACGMSDRLRLDLVLNDFVAGAMTCREISILSDGTPWRPLIHVRDMARAIDWAIGRDPIAGGAFLAVNAGSNEWNYQVRELAETVARLIPGVRVSVNADAPPDRRSYRVNFDLYARLAPQHQPQVDLAEAIRDLEDGLTSMGLRDPNFRESAYIRLKTLTGLRARGLLDESLQWTGRAPSALAPAEQMQESIA
jgi:nucleoside-diphosphate-sugar epimerase